MTIEEVIAYLEQCREDFGGHTEVVVTADDIVDDQMDFIALDQIPDWADTYGGFRKSRRGTATTEHLVSITVSQDGDDPVDPDDLAGLISLGLTERHVEVLGVHASPNLMARELAMVLDDESTYTSLSGCSIREYSDEGDPGEVLFVF